MRSDPAKNVEVPMREIRRRLSWVEFLSPLSEAEMVALLRGARFVSLEDGQEMVVGAQEHAERMLVLVAGQLQVFEVSLSSGHELTLSVAGDGAAVGATGLVPRWTRDLHLRARRGAWLPGALAGFALLVSLLGLPGWAAITGGASLQVKEQQVSVGYWIRENLPPGARVGINDAGAIRYYGEHPTVDLIGLTTNGLALPSRHGPGSLYEALEKMPEEQRPDYFAVYPNWFSSFSASGLFGEEIATFSLSSRPEVAGIVGGSEVDVFRADWGLARSGDTFRGEGTVRDTLDVADLGSERKHDYEMRMPLIGLEPDNVLTREHYPDGEVVLDGGRGLPGGEEFTITGLSRNRPVEMVMRTTSAPFALQVHADSKLVGEWNFQPSGSGWQETTFTIPEESVRSGSLRVRLSPPEDAPLEGHTAYHYWFVQRR
jgi:hypothetical protein